MSRRASGYELRRVATELQGKIKEAPGVSEITVIGGERREVRVLLDPERLAAHRITPARATDALRAANVRAFSGPVTNDNRSLVVEAGNFLSSRRDVEGPSGS